MTTRIPPDVIKRIEALVASGAYPSTDDAFRDAVKRLDEPRQTSATTKDAKTMPAKKQRTKRSVRSSEKWLADFDAWVKSHKPIGHYVDDSRDSIYE